MSAKFTPCYVCGEPNEIGFHKVKTATASVQQTCVRCSTCGATTHYYDTTDEALHFWNLRNTTVADLKKELFQLRSLLAEFFSHLDRQAELTEEDGPDEAEFALQQIENLSEALRANARQLV